MTKLEILNRKILALEKAGQITEEEYATYKALLEAKRMVAKLEEHLDWIGWGDRYERECSEDLRKELDAFRGRLK